MVKRRFELGSDPRAVRLHYSQPDAAMKANAANTRLFIHVVWIVVVLCAASVAGAGAAQVFNWPKHSTFGDRSAAAGLMLAAAAIAISVVGFVLTLAQTRLASEQSRQARSAAEAARAAVDRAETQLRRNSVFGAISETQRLEAAFDAAILDGAVSKIRVALLDWRRGANSLRAIVDDFADDVDLSGRLRETVIAATDAKVELDDLDDEADAGVVIAGVRKAIAEIGNELEAFAERYKYKSGGGGS